MKKIHRKIIHSQARYLNKLVKDIKSITKGFKDSYRCCYDASSKKPARKQLFKTTWYYYSKEERRGILMNNAQSYKPYLLKNKVKHLSLSKKASIMREIYAKAVEEITLESSVIRKKIGRQYSINGDFYQVKSIICKNLFS